MNTKPNKTAATGRYKVAVVDAATNQVVWEMNDWKSNMILTSGMDKKSELPWEDLFTHAVAGNGTTSNYISTGDTVWFQYLQVFSDGVKNVNLMAGSIVPGDTLVLDGPGGYERCIADIINGTAFSPDESLFQAAGAWTNLSIAKTSRTQLDNELKRTGAGGASTAWFVGWPYCGTVIEGPIVKMRRTFDFSVDGAQTTYNEIGFTWSEDPAEPLFSRILLDEPVVVDSGHFLRAFYELQVDHFPDIPSMISVPIMPITSTAMMCIQGFSGTCTSYVATNGSSSGTPLVEGLDKNSSQYAFISDSQAELQTFGTYWNPTTDGPTFAKRLATKEPYRGKSFYIVQSATFEPGAFVGLSRLYGMCGNNVPWSWETYYVGMKMLSDTYEPYMTVTPNDQVLVRWTYGWGRTFGDMP